MKGSTVAAILLGALVIGGVAYAAGSSKPKRSPITTIVGKTYRFKGSIRPPLKATDALGLKAGLEASGAKNVVMDFTASNGTFLEWDMLEAFSVTITPGASSLTIQGHTLSIDDVQLLPPELGGSA